MHVQPCFGIDLGTTFSSIGWVDGGRPTLLPVDDQLLLPSVVFFPRDGEPVVGLAALNALLLEPERTIRSAKRFMGTDQKWEIDGREVRPSDVGACVLRRLCAAARIATGIHPTRVVITVPAWFNQVQRADTRKAGEAAGLEVVRIINEPTAAALAHAHGRDLKRKALVYDFGGGTFDVSLVEQNGPIMEVLASHGDTRLGGDDIDEALAWLILERLEARGKGISSAIRASAPARLRLLLAATETKIRLSSVVSTHLRIPFLFEWEGRAWHVDEELRRMDLEMAIERLLVSTLTHVDLVLSDAGIKAAEVDDLLLVGGSTRIPRVWSLLRERYGLEGSAAVPPDLAVGLGAAIQAAIVDGSRVDGILLDVAPFSLSVGTVSSVLLPLEPGTGRHFICRVITPRNDPLPSRHSAAFFTSSPDQEEIHIPIFQGSNANPLRNVVLGEVRLDGLPPAPRGQGHRPVTVEFFHDLDGMVEIRLTDDLSGRSVRGEVAMDGGEVHELRGALVDRMRREGLVPGNGGEEDPFADKEPDRLPDREVGTSDADCLALFRSVLEHPEQVSHDMLDLAARGMEALDRGAPDEAGGFADTLADLLFESGIYL